jgi:hypothetical protein
MSCYQATFINRTRSTTLNEGSRSMRWVSSTAPSFTPVHITPSLPLLQPRSLHQHKKHCPHDKNPFLRFKKVHTVKKNMQIRNRPDVMGSSSSLKDYKMSHDAELLAVSCCSFRLQQFSISTVPYWFIRSYDHCWARKIWFHNFWRTPYSLLRDRREVNRLPTVMCLRSVMELFLADEQSTLRFIILF